MHAEGTCARDAAQTLCVLDSLLARHQRLLDSMKSTSCSSVSAAKEMAIMAPGRQMAAQRTPLPLEELTRQFTQTAIPRTAAVQGEPFAKKSVLPSEKAKQSRWKKVWHSPFTGIAFYAFMATIVVLAYFAKGIGTGVPKPLFGLSGQIVLTRSMQSEIPQGSLVIAQETDPDKLQIGDDITFLRNNEVTYTHRIVGITDQYYEGKRGFTTQGVENELPDKETVIADNLVGKVIFHSHTLGLFFHFVQSNLWLCVGLIIMVMLFFYGLRMFLSKKRKHEAAKET